MIVLVFAAVFRRVMNDKKPTAFEKGNESAQDSLVAEFLQFLRHNKKYWLIPLLLALFGLELLVVLGGTAAAPFIYTLFYPERTIQPARVSGANASEDASVLKSARASSRDIIATTLERKDEI